MNSVTIKTEKMTYNYPYLSVIFEFEFDRKEKGTDITLEKVKGLIYDAFNETYSNEIYTVMVDFYYNKKLDADIYHIIEIVEVPEDIHFNLV